MSDAGSIDHLLQRSEVVFPSSQRFNYRDPNAKANLIAHRQAVEEDLPWYRDVPSGNLVITAVRHLRRGMCCYCGCRHCPYVDGERPPTGVCQIQP